MWCVSVPVGQRATPFPRSPHHGASAHVARRCALTTIVVHVGGISPCMVSVNTSPPSRGLVSTLLPHLSTFLPLILLPTQPTHVTASPAIHTAPTNPHATTQPHLHASCQCPHATPPSPHHLHPPHSTATAPASHPQAQTMPSFVRVAVAVARIVGVPELGAGAAWHVATPGSSGAGGGGFRRPLTAVACAPFRAVGLQPNF